jgi:osmotically-inducible protein OsmY
MKKLGLVAVVAAVGAWFLAGSRRQVLVGKFRSIATRVLQPKDYDDATLKDKVESELFRDEHEVKGAISINAQEGVVQLRGELPSQDLIDALVDRTQKIHGVREVESLLHTPGNEAPMHH